MRRLIHYFEDWSMAAHYDNNKNVNGIICDLCGTVLIDKFEYYSGKLDFVEVDRAVGKHGIKDIDRRFLDIDFCPACWKELEDRIRKNLEKISSRGAWSASTKPKGIQHKQRMRP
jgi:hypothetical protein